MPLPSAFVWCHQHRRTHLYLRGYVSPDLFLSALLIPVRPFKLTIENGQNIFHWPSLTRPLIPFFLPIIIQSLFGFWFPPHLLILYSVGLTPPCPLHFYLSSFIFMPSRPFSKLSLPSHVLIAFPSSLRLSTITHSLPAISPRLQRPSLSYIQSQPVDSEIETKGLYYRRSGTDWCYTVAYRLHGMRPPEWGSRQW